MTATLHIEHRITDYPTWRAAFDRFAERRTAAGVTAHRIKLVEDDPHHIVIDLDFETAAAAHAFSTVLHEQVWRTPLSPALVGEPTTRVLVAADG